MSIIHPVASFSRQICDDDNKDQTTNVTQCGIDYLSDMILFLNFDNKLLIFLIYKSKVTNNKITKKIETQPFWGEAQAR